MFEVKDGSRTLQFNGKLLGSSSSWRRGSNRWIEFAIYKTENGSYILSRVGVSLVYHVSSCPLVSRYGLQEQNTVDVAEDAVPCLECRPTLEAPVVFPEKYRYWAQVSEDAESILDALYKDDNGARYLTKVAQRVLEEAAEHDANIDSIYRVELIP
jgi:hypothetical protein